MKNKIPYSIELDIEAVEEYLQDTCFDEEDLKVCNAFKRIKEFIEEVE